MLPVLIGAAIASTPPPEPTLVFGTTIRIAEAYSTDPLAGAAGDGCLAADYSKKALSFIIHINPNLPQAYGTEDVTNYLINLMPKALRGEGRRIKSELIAQKRMHDHMHVIERCRAIVQEEQKTSAAAPALVLASESLELYGLASLADDHLRALERTTGMRLDTGSPSPHGGGGRDGL